MSPNVWFSWEYSQKANPMNDWSKVVSVLSHWTVTVEDSKWRKVWEEKKEFSDEVPLTSFWAASFWTAWLIVIYLDCKIVFWALYYFVAHLRPCKGTENPCQRSETFWRLPRKFCSPTSNSPVTLPCKVVMSEYRLLNNPHFETKFIFSCQVFAFFTLFIFLNCHCQLKLST